MQGMHKGGQRVKVMPLMDVCTKSNMSVMGQAMEMYAWPIYGKIAIQGLGIKSFRWECLAKKCMPSVCLMRQSIGGNGLMNQILNENQFHIYHKNHYFHFYMIYNVDLHNNFQVYNLIFQLKHYYDKINNH